MFLCGINYALGSLCPIADLIGDEPEDVIRLLIAKGIDTYSCFDTEPPLDLVADSVERTLQDAAIAASAIDLVIVVTESYEHVIRAAAARGDTEFRARRNELFDIITSLGIHDAVYLSTTYGGSSNFLQAVYVAQALLESGRACNALLLCADRHPSGTSRFMELAISMTGDGLATCVLTAAPQLGPLAYEIEHVGITRYRPLSGRDQMVRMVLEMYRASKSAAADCYERIGRQPHAYDHLILNNYNQLTCRVFAQLLGFTLDRTFLRNAPRTGHIPACDPLINLKDLAPAPGSTVLLYANGPMSCGTISLKVRR